MRHSVRRAVALLPRKGSRVCSATLRPFSSSTDEPVVVDASPVPSSSESVDLDRKEKMTFQAETKRLLEIVAKSLYTDKEIFIRELISNASDACEKARFMMSSGKELVDADEDLKIVVECDEERGTLTIRDTGIGMTKDELVQNLGTIAHSGTKQFVQSIDSSASAADNVIGQFGVGFYSVFMVADKVDVFSRSAAGGDGHYWTSDGHGSYEICPAENVARGTKIVLHLKPDAKEFATKKVVKRVAKKHSNFVSFPVEVNGKRLESIGAIWLKNPSEVEENEHTEFYRYIADAYDKPEFKYHFHADVPLSIHALFYLPQSHMEKYGLGRMDPGVNLYSRRVLIQPKSTAILPGWLRFVKGAVDSEDIPLNISRENMQDTSLIQKIKNVLTRKIISFLNDTAKHEPEKYNKWYQEFGNFIREGVATDMKHRNEIARLLRYQTSRTEPGEVASLDEYISRMPPQQKNIYYLFAPSREVAESSPYLEAFKEENFEVLFLNSSIDEMVMTGLRTFEGRDIKSAESEEAEISDKKGSKHDTSAEAVEMADWFKSVLGEKLVKSVRPTRRPVKAPAIIVDQDSSNIRQMLIMMELEGRKAPVPAQKLEINPQHPIILGLNSMRETNPELAKIIARQVLDNAMIAAGILTEPRSMVDRITEILTHSVSARQDQNLDDSDAELSSASTEDETPTVVESAPATQNESKPIA